MKKLIDAYIYRESSNEIEFLILQRAKDRIYADQWRMVGGKVKQNEEYAHAALREIEEEVQLRPSFFWVVPSINTFFEDKTNQILHIPAFAAKAPGTFSPILDDEHKRYKWIHISEVSDYIFWPEQQRLMVLIANIVEKKQIVSEWIIKY
ncbi:MAG: NUDIX domain-containing protein [Balneola sp.]|nr:NUDIX domain-containing protein [Balneola sp.]